MRSTTMGVFVLLFAAGAAAGDGAVVRLAEEVAVASPRILLGAIARVDADDPSLAERLSRVLVGFAPPADRVRTLGRFEIRQALALAGFGPDEVVLAGAEAVRVVRPSQRVGDGRLARAVMTSVAERLGLDPDELVLTRLSIRDEAVVPRGELELRVVLPEAPRLGEPVDAKVLVLVDGLPAGQVGVTIEAARRSDTSAVARRPARGAGERLVRRGERVALELEGPGLLISAAGRAQASGRLGDRIPVENLISGIVVHGIVKGKGRVRVPWMAPEPPRSARKENRR